MQINLFRSIILKEARNKHKTDVIRADETADEISPEKFIAFIENIPD